MRAGRFASFALLIAGCAAAAGTRVVAHRLDELLQAARIAIEPDRVGVEVVLTPGVAVAETVIRDIDRDRNGALSAIETQAYAARVLEAIAVDLDATAPIRLALTSATIPDPDALRTGAGSITLHSRASLQGLTAGEHRLVFRNTFAPAASVYLANALVPESDAVTVTGQRRDADQRELAIEFTVRGGDTPGWRNWFWLGGALALALPLRHAASRRRFAGGRPASRLRI